MGLGSQYKMQKRLYQRIAIGVLAILCILLLLSVIERYRIERDMAARRAELEQEFQVLEERRNALETKVEYLDDESSVEAEIRRSFDVARAGEQVVIILDDEEAAESAAEPAPEVVVLPPWWQFWR